jgi:hypothetical protein
MEVLMGRKSLFDIWWDAAICKDGIKTFAQRAKRAGYSYEDCRRFIWTAAGSERLHEVKDEVWKPSRLNFPRRRKDYEQQPRSRDSPRRCRST